MAGGARANAGAGSYPLRSLVHRHSGMARKRQTRNLEIPGSMLQAALRGPVASPRNDREVWMRSAKSILIALLAIASISSAHAQSLPGGFVYLRDIDPGIIQDIRYATSNNFVGRPLAGYGAGECVVKREVGLRLKAVQQDLAAQNLSLKMFDCYRPARASLDMVAWSQNGRETAAERRYNPRIAKTELFRLGYIASRSQHSTGAALDLTLVDLKADNSGKYDPSKTYADCTASVEARPPEGSVDMGTGYDCTDTKGHTAAPSITPDQRAWRKRLMAAMAKQGFVNYSKEWWHFSLPGAGGAAYDFPIQPRRN
ncbi:bll5098 [Bradyrhizobium diazoefficiens USDA 110]|uniref:D-alanyl-D-alanine dipeptidase n=2 Tax=Bradyrhizobium diazoefficiens TaxID=1355477 RepID=Q89K20_BRADU|nr:dipeptidase [Bradyrhizobium diazoefficiens]QBP23883.1 dipeptidase [Bradyrhizobium diazoefficiens]BAC50363.1 bll5098 [Bradyrhizobium diazoefficiens USDA 110]